MIELFRACVLSREEGFAKWPYGLDSECATSCVSVHRYHRNAGQAFASRNAEKPSALGWSPTFAEAIAMSSVERGAGHASAWTPLSKMGLNAVQGRSPATVFE